MAQKPITFTDNLDEVLSKLDGALASGLALVGAKAQGYAKDNTPVRTGTLRDSIGVQVKASENSVYIGTMIEKFPDEPYGKYVELGARGNPGKHMLKRAATEHTAEYKRILEEALKNA